MRKTELSGLNVNPFKLIGKEWFLVTSGNPESYNTMTASWGQMGHLWGKDVFTCHIRPNRHTFGFIEENDLFTVSFFREDYKSALAFCGSRSGRDCDKAKETGLTPIPLGGSITFEEAYMVFVCKKLYTEPMKADGFILGDIVEKFYGTDPLHKSFTAEIVEVFVK